MSLELDDRQRAMLQELGVHVWMPQSPALTMAATPMLTPAAVPAVASPVVTAVTPAVVPITAPAARDALDWPALADAAAQCRACGLCAGRTRSTLQPPAQAALADWFVVGDAPDDDENQQGCAFAGPAGQLLDNMLKAMGARRDGTGAQGAYVTNIVKCRPPGVRLPQPHELDQCAAYLQRELALVQPKVILAMGRQAIARLLAEHPEAIALPLGKQRGSVYRYQGIPVVVTYAPKVLLRASADKAKAWADLCLALDVRDGLH